MADDWATAGDTPSGYLPADDFRAAMDSIYGAGNWRETGGWRSQSREQQLRASGAGTVKPGATSWHSLGTEDAPGAHDIVVNGMTPQQAAAKLRASQLPVGNTFPEDAAGGQGAHLHVGMAPGLTSDPWSAAPAASDPWATAGGPPEATPKQDLLTSASRLIGSLVGGGEEGAAAALRGGGRLLDILSREQAQEYASGVGPGGLPVPERSRQVMEAAATDKTPVIAGAVDPWATALETQAGKTEPAARNMAESALHGAGGFAPLLAAGAINPALGAAVFASQGYQDAYQEAKSKGKSDQDAQRAGLANAGVQAGVGVIPFSKPLEPVVSKVGGAITGALARTGAEAAGGAAMGAASQAGANLVAEQNYDPDRPVTQGVGAAALGGALAGGVIHGATEVGGAVGARLRQREQPVTPAPEQAAAAAQEAIPEAVAAQAYRDMTAVTPAETPAIGASAEGVENAGQPPAEVPASAPEAPQTLPQTEAANPIPTRPPPDYEAARIAEGAAPEHMPQAIADVAELRQAAPKSYNVFQAMKDLGGIRTNDAEGNVDGDVAQALGGARMPGLINNKTGLTPDAMREALQERGWFGAFDQRQGADEVGPKPGDNVQDLFDLMDRHVRDGPVRHPEAEGQEQIARRAELESEMLQAGVGVKDLPAVAAAKLAAWRGALAKQSGEEMASLIARAESSGVPHVPGMGYDELLGDVVEREAIQHDYDGATADHDEHLIDAELTPEEHEWLAAAGRGAEGEQESPGGLAEALRGAAPEPGAQAGGGEPGEGAGGGGAWAHEVSGLPELVAVDPNAIVRAWEKGWGPFRDHHGEVEAAMEHGRQIIIPRDVYEREIGGSPFEAHVREHSEFEGAPDPWAIAGEKSEPAPAAPTEKVNLGHETVQQGILGDMTQSAKQAAAARGEVLRPTVAQQEHGGLFAAPEPEQDELKFQRAANFYSPAERAVAASTLQSAPAEQWKSTIRNTPGVKKEELEWLGLDDWLDMFGDEKVAKSAVQAFLRDGGVKVDEKLIGNPVLDRSSPYYGPRVARVLTRAQDPVLELENDGDAYRELMAKHPGLVEDEDWAKTVADSVVPGWERGTQFEDWKLPGGTDYHELLFTLPKIEQPPATHWDTPGVMAHVRFDTRPDVDGKQVLFIEEVQSDWHQKGRDQGYAQQASEEEKAAALKALNEAHAAADAVLDRLVPLAEEAKRVAPNAAPFAQHPFGVHNGHGAEYWLRDAERSHQLEGDLLERVRAGLRDREATRLRANEATQRYEQAHGEGGIANAPFKSSWPALVMKRMILWAADHGFDRVAWTTGDQQADRYDLTKHIGAIELRDNNSGGIGRPEMEGPFKAGRLIIRAPDGGSVQDHHIFGNDEAEARARLTDIIGAELTDKLLAAPTEERRESGMGFRHRHLEGLDIKTGGEGMRAFYDRNLVNITNDLIKKYGTKVGKTKIATADFEELQHFAESDRRAVQAATERYERAKDNPATAPYLKDSLERAQEAAAQSLDRLQKAQAGDDQHSFDITDKMREAAKTGLPLFQAGDQGSAAGAFKPVTRGLQGREITPEQASDVVDRVAAVLARIAPHAEAKPFASLRTDGGKQAFGATFRDGAGHVIAWALDAPDALQTVRHEAVHALRTADLFKPAEWSALSSEALRGDWLGRFSIHDRYPDLKPEQQIEEAIAERYGEWRQDIAVKDLPSFAKALFQRIKDALGHVAATVRQALGHDVRAEDVFRAIESGRVGAREPAAPGTEPGSPPVRYAVPPDDAKAEKARGFVNKALGDGMDAVGAKISRTVADVLPDPLIDFGDAIRMGLNPMAAGSQRAQATAKDFANAWREHAWEWSRVDRWLENTFTPEQRRKMWEAADEDSVVRQRGAEPGPVEGLNRLTPEERAAVEELQKRANAAFGSAKDLGMTTAEGLPSYVPRMVVEMTAEGAKRLRPSGEQGSGSGGVGRNLKTTSAQLKQRKYLETSETEAAAQKAFGEGATVVRDIRTLALATGKLEQAVAGRRLVQHIKEAGAAVGENLVSEGASADPKETFTLDHPAMRIWRPKLSKNPVTGKWSTVDDSATGRPVMESQPLYIAKEFEGPLKAVLTQSPGAVEKALMTLKGKAMSVIMYSPLMHNAVIWGKAIPAAPKAVLGFTVYRKGYLAKTDPATMREAIRAGLDPIGKKFFNQDITAIASPPQIEPGQSWTAKLLASTISAPARAASLAAGGKRTPAGRDLAEGADRLSRATKEQIDRLGDLWHNTFLWDRVGDLQMGIYTILRDSFVKHGMDPQTGQRVAAHYANRYAGALPMEAMSKLARNVANITLFSRSFTMTNLGAWKDAVAGLPTDVQAQIMRDKGFQELKQAQGTARGKAMAMIVMDIALAHVGLLLAAGAVWGVHHMLGDPSFAFQGPGDNEKGKENRVLMGYQPDGTAIYGRLPTGKVAEDLLSWVTEPISTAERKLSPYGKVALEVASNDKGFGRKLYDPYDKTPLGFLRNTGRVVLGADLANLHSPDDFTGGLLGSFTPVGLLQGLAHLGSKSEDPRTAALEATLPLFGITVSKGAPGGPAMGDLFRAQDEHDFQVAEKLPGIRKDIKAGRIVEARQMMTKLGIAPGLQSYYVRTTLNPAQRLTGRKLHDFLQYATPADRSAFEADQAAALSRRQTVAP